MVLGPYRPAGGPVLARVCRNGVVDNPFFWIFARHGCSGYAVYFILLILVGGALGYMAQLLGLV
jgi:hypothetical protein